MIVTVIDNYKITGKKKKKSITHSSCLSSLIIPFPFLNKEKLVLLLQLLKQSEPYAGMPHRENKTHTHPPPETARHFPNLKKKKKRTVSLS